MEVAGGEVTFRYKDYRRQGKAKEMTLGAGEFCRRFLRHVLPGGFVRVRHYELLANHGRAEKLARCRALVGQAAVLAGGAEPVAEGEAASEGGRRCEACGRVQMCAVAAVAPRREDSS